MPTLFGCLRSLVRDTTPITKKGLQYPSGLLVLTLTHPLFMYQVDTVGKVKIFFLGSPKSLMGQSSLQQLCLGDEGEHGKRPVQGFQPWLSVFLGRQAISSYRLEM